MGQNKTARQVTLFGRTEGASSSYWICKELANSEQFHVQALGASMPRPDILDVTIMKELTEDELLDMKIISDKELRVKCVVDYSSK